MDSFKGEKHINKNCFLGDLTGGQVGARMDASKSDRISFLIQVASAAFDLDVTLRQHDAAAAGTSKDIVVTSPYFVKLDASLVATKKEIVAAAQVVDADFNGAAGYLLIEVLGEDLDRENGFSYVSVDIAQGAGARIGHISGEGHLVRNKPAYKETI